MLISNPNLLCLKFSCRSILLLTTARNTFGLWMLLGSCASTSKTGQVVCVRWTLVDWGNARFDIDRVGHACIDRPWVFVCVCCAVVFVSTVVLVSKAAGRGPLGKHINVDKITLHVCQLQSRKSIVSRVREVIREVFH